MNGHAPGDGETGRGDLTAVVEMLRRRWWIIALCAILGAAVAAGVAQHQPKKYTTSASLLLQPSNADESLFGAGASQSPADPERNAATNLELVSLHVVAQRVVNRLPGHGLTVDRLRSEVEIHASDTSDVISIQATDHDPTLAAHIANNFATQFILFRRNADRAAITDAQTLLQRQLAATQTTRGPEAGALRAQLQRRLEDLRVLAALQTSNAQLVQPAKVPTSPSSPKVRRSALLGLFAGLVLGLGVALLREQLDRRLRGPEQMRDAFKLPILATVPRSAGLRSGNLIPVAGPEADAFRRLDANLGFVDLAEDVRSVVVTSGRPEEGKSTIALNLAAMAAERRGRVLLMEADLRRPRLAAHLGLEPEPGLSALLADPRLTLADVLHEDVAVATAPDVHAPRRIDVVLAGAVPFNAPELLSSSRMRDLLRQVEAEYDLVVVDTAPIGVVADAIPFMREASGVIVVGRVSQTDQRTAANVVGQLSMANARTLGLVANCTPGHEPYYGYAYTNGKAPK